MTHTFISELTKAVEASTNISGTPLIQPLVLDTHMDPNLQPWSNLNVGFSGAFSSATPSLTLESRRAENIRSQFYQSFWLLRLARSFLYLKNGLAFGLVAITMIVEIIPDLVNGLTRHVGHHPGQGRSALDPWHPGQLLQNSIEGLQERGEVCSQEGLSKLVLNKLGS